MKTKKIIFTATACLFLFATSAYSMPILVGSEGADDVWTASDGEGRLATADFNWDGSELQIILTNLADETSQPNELLAGLFFTFSDGFSINTPSVMVNGGSDLVILDTSKTDGEDHGSNLNGEWGFNDGLENISGDLGGYYGISNTALDAGLNAPAGWYDGVFELIDETIEYGENTGTANGPSFGIASNPTALSSSIWAYVDNSVLISFTGVGEFVGLEKVNFIYGTDMAAPVPEPATMLLFGTGLVGLAGIARRKSKK